MSKIGKRKIEIPQGVTVKYENRKLIVEGPKGKLEFEIFPGLDLEIKDNEILVIKKGEGKKVQAMWGTTRQLIKNMIEGVTKGFEKKLEISGLGYRAEMKGKDLILHVGYSHPVIFPTPEGVQISAEKNIIIVSGINKELVGNVAAKIRKIREVEPYKGKGIKYLDEVVKRKLSKKQRAGK
jgi:large subunit ribosomal protein L6